jgi:hypothetical protein
MPISKDESKPKPKQQVVPTTETVSWVGGLFKEYVEQLGRYHHLTSELLSLQARVELVEKNLCVTRDHLALAIEKSEEPMPEAWEKALASARFVGMRLADACLAILQQRKKVTHHEMLEVLNWGMFRFRTNAPAREIHGAMLRQPYVKRVSDGWIWAGPEVVEPVPQPTLRLIVEAPGGEKTTGQT